MIRAIIAAVMLALTFAVHAATTPVDVNKADRAALESVKGIGPASAEAILTERKKGNFRDWPDFESRMKGVGDARAIRLSDAGLTINGEARPGGSTTAAASAKKTTEGSARK